MTLDLAHSIIEPHASLPDWLAARDTFIGASESPALFGCGYANQSPLTIAMDKLGQREREEDEESEAMTWGTELQDAIATQFGRRIGKEVSTFGRFTILRHADHPHIGATLDNHLESESAVVELKNVGSYNAREWDGDEPPLRVQVQVQQQMFCAGADHAYVVALIGGNRLTWKVVERHERFIGELVRRLDQFWAEIHAGKLPEIDGSAATTEALKSLYRATSGETVELPAELEGWDAKLCGAKLAIKVAEAVKSEAENRIRAALGTAVRGVLPGGVEYHSPVTTVNHAAKEAYTSEYRALRRKAAK